MNLDQVKVVSWDLDGTLYSIRRMRIYLFRSLLRETVHLRGRRARRDLTLLKRERNLLEQVRTLGGVLNQEPGDEALLEVEKSWYGPAIRSAGLRKGVLETIEFFTSNGFGQVVYSDNEVGFKLEALGLSNRFRRAYVGKDFGVLKPNPLVLEIIARDCDVPIESVLHIGDRTDTDRAAAQAAGCQALILGRDVRDFHSLLKMLKES